MKNVCLSLFFLVLIASCKDQVSESSEAVATESKMMMAPNVKDVAYDEAVVDTASVSVSQPATPSDTKIIKSANLKFETQDISNSYSVIQKAVQKYNAIVQSDASGKDYGSVFRNLTLRIPCKNFDVFITEISQGVAHFDTKEISQQDVSEEYIDVESRMKSKKKLEERYLQLLAKAGKVSEMLEIEKKLSEIREEIEAKEGQLKYMQNRIAMSTVTIEMYTNNASESGATVSYPSKIWNSIKEGFNGLSNFMLSILSIWPFILIFAVTFFWFKRRIWKRKQDKL